MLLKAFLVAIYAGLAGIDLFDGLSHIHRPLVSGLIVGLILGDMKMGLIAGATLELVWMGAVPVGGAQPPNVVVGGIIGSAFAIMAKQDPTVAVGIAIPFAVAVQACITLLFTFFSPVMHKADKYAESCNTKGIERINYLGMGILFIFYFTVVFLPISIGAEAAQGIVSLLPPWLIKGFGVAGGMMPAIGFALLLNIMFKKEYIIFFVLGFILATYLNLPVIAIAAIGFIIAIYDYQKSKSVDKIKKLSLTSSTEEDYSDGI
ncbi:PTS N-acetylgalactosamine transporter subunit IIC [Cetobacterium somerae]|uniref:PTS N-acetylgalactosamine transporter subunit IIC n=1 Tax=Cetobacterium somerae TaxID=188913 RepID=UPI001F05326E|nr:PTS N-acetylgalactosamine transporter subunit IIC [Cetobacterium somerae]UPO96683.1 PTS N-acetylgalactosamine transporter subunit IIC [Cetobacterium somerae]